ncbi:glycosyltransferase family 2 protein [Caulobacter sp. NIBR2454]|uniref:glycosyltransferase family 2 protein n=1 Tax=Caulobacter sp. NIBR2454 TaxID=3015996 RepID=UPI0022B7078C|nr:glycosyltransferase family 2 protein [Caulobacter sp. NIBR2454]
MPQASPPAVSVLIVAYQSAPTLQRCLDSLAAQTFTDFETIVLDNASTDDGAAIALAAPGVRVIRADRNLGFAAGNNAAAKAARGRWIALLNPDAYAQADWLERFMAAAQAHRDVRCFTARQLMDEDPSRLDGLGDVMSLVGVPFRGGYGALDLGGPAGEVFSACGAAMMIERDLFAGLGGFDERFFCYCEDVDLGYRLRLIGEATRLVPDAVVRHTGSASNAGPRSAFALYHGARNRLWAYVQNTPPLLLALTIAPHAAFTALLMARHVLRGETKPALRGLGDGLKGLGEALARRRVVQATRTATSLQIAAAMSLNPLAWLRAAPVVKKA